MADKSKKKNIFQKMGQVFKEVRQELKKSVWPTKEKLSFFPARFSKCKILVDTSSGSVLQLSSKKTARSFFIV